MASMTEYQINTLFAVLADKIQMMEYQLQQKDEEIKTLQESNLSMLNIKSLDILMPKGDDK